MTIAKKDTGIYYEYTADDEEPNCICCENQWDCTGKYCGPEYGWNNYVRYVLLDESKGD